MASSRLLAMLASPTVLAAMACGTLSGCHLADRLPPAPVPDVKPIREQRKSEVVQEFEQQRNSAQYQAALSFWERGEKETGKEMLEQILRRVPNHRDSRIALAEFAIESNDLSAARRQAAEIESRFPNDVQALETLAAVHELAGETSQAETYLRRASEQDTQNLQPVVLSQPESVEAKAKGAAKPVKHDAPPKTAAKPNAPVPLRPEQQPAKAASVAQHPSTTLLAAEICLAVGRADEARQLVESVLSQNTDDAEAQKMAQRVGVDHRAKPPKPRPHSVISSTIREQSEPRSLQPVPAEEPQRFADEPRMLADADEPPLHDSVAQQAPLTQQATDDSQPADAVDAPATMYPKTAAEAKPVKASDRKHQTASNEWLRKGIVALEVEATESARRLFERALDAASDEKEASEVAVATLRHGQTEWTIQLAQSGLKRYPQSASLYRILGTAQYRLNDFEASQVALRQALSLDKTSALSYFLLGCTLSKLGDREGADWHYRQARLRDARFASK